MQRQSITACYHSLIAAVIGRAIDDLKKNDLNCQRVEKDRAMAFIMSDTCERYCLELEVDYKVVKEKAASLYQEITEREKPRKERYTNSPGQLSGNRLFLPCGFG